MKASRLLCVGASIALAALVSGCSSNNAPQPLPQADAHPHIVTDLSSLSSDTTEFQPKIHSSGLMAKVDDPGSAQVFQATPGLSREIGTDRTPAFETLLNGKAAQYANFSQTLMERVYAQLRILERTDEISILKLPTEIHPTVVTAIMDRNGKLKEIILEQHSGKTALDKMVIEACKKSLWYPNPPVGALSEGGDYRLTVQVHLENFASQDDRHWDFTTKIGLGIG
ncbi:MAG TPA: TonB C-terminal domain-containing protein [Candidatus Binataceae bacterium]|nr:TonB C-terminal domain-containing protein [Candidatus Binataceae bacterium]